MADRSKRGRHSCVFISYARSDGATLAGRLQRDLSANGLDAWLDTQDIGGGASWTVAIEQAIDAADVVLALMTTGSFRSDICRAEQLRSLRGGKCVIPVLAEKGSDVPLHLETKNYRDFTQTATYRKRFQQLLDDIARKKGVGLLKRYRETRVSYITAPPMVANYIERPDVLEALRNTLFAPDRGRAIALTALEGMGGIGKTVLAQALCRDEVVQQAFPDGIVWITAGRESRLDVQKSLREAAKVLGDDKGDYDTELAAANEYRTSLATKAALVVIDDVWSRRDVEPFLAESPRSRFLFTTRDASIASFVGAREHRLDLLDEAQSRALLARWAKVPEKRLPPAAAELIRECGRLPMALVTIGAQLRGASQEEWTDVLELMRRADRAALESRFPAGEGGFFRAVDVSVAALEPAMRGHYLSLAVLLEDVPTALPVLQALWNVSASEARRIGRHLVDRSLAQRDEGAETLRLHDLQLDYVRDQSPLGKALPLIHGALRLGAHAVAADPMQFASQMIGRLLPFADDPAISGFLTSLAQGAPTPWIRPLRPGLLWPGGPLIRTLDGHSKAVLGVAMTPDGHLAVSASADRTLRIWDLDSGRVLSTLKGHAKKVNAVAVSADGRVAVSASADRTLRVWDLRTGRKLRTLKGHARSVKDVALTADGRVAISASADHTLRMWHVEDGQCLNTLKGHADKVETVAISADGQRAVSGSLDKSLRIWNLRKSGTARRLTGSADPDDGEVGRPADLTMTPDGRQAISADLTGTLRVWNLDTREEARTLDHPRWVTAVALSADGHRAVSTDHAVSLTVWDVDSGVSLRTTPTGHAASARALAVSADGRRAVSGSYDHSLKVWDLEARDETPPGTDHSAAVRALAVTPDGRRLVSASDDRTVKIWDVSNGNLLHVMEGHTDVVRAVALTPDGKRILSGSWDRNIRIWDIQTGRELRTIDAHTHNVSGIAVTADGRTAVSSSWDFHCFAWDLGTGAPLWKLSDVGQLLAVAISGDGQTVACASDDGTVRVWDLKTGARRYLLEGHKDEVNAVVMTADGRRAVSASDDHTIKEWDLVNGRLLRTLEGHESAVTDVKLSPDGRLLISTSVDRTLKLWNFRTGDVIATFSLDSVALCCATADFRTIFVGDTLQRIHFLQAIQTI